MCTGMQFSPKENIKKKTQKTGKYNLKKENEKRRFDQGNAWHSFMQTVLFRHFSLFYSYIRQIIRRKQ